LSPLTEQFSVIIGFQLYCPYVLPNVPRDLPSQYSHILGRSDSATIVIGDGVDFMALIFYFLKETIKYLRVCIEVGIFLFAFLGLPICRWLCK